jgi:hypothetical protein
VLHERNIEHVRQQIAESYRVCPPPCPVETRRRELAEERERQAREAREAEEKRQVAANDWYGAADRRVHEHLQNWLWNAIDERIKQHIELAQKPLVEATGEVLGQFRAALRHEFKHAIEELADEVGVRLAALEERLASNSSWVDGRIEATLAHERDELKRAVEEAQRSFETKLAALEERLRAVPGKLPVAKTWHPESVTYQAEFVCYEGALWQACTDTAQAPGGSDWVCVARAGRDGCDGQTPNFRGRHDAYQKYQQFDVIEFDGSSFVALYDNPGIPGDPGWQILSKNGSRGPVGDVGPRGRKGERGARGEDSLTIVSWTLDRKNYRAVPTMSSGQAGAPLDLRGLFEQYLLETSAAIPA